MSTYNTSILLSIVYGTPLMQDLYKIPFFIDGDRGHLL